MMASTTHQMLRKNIIKSYVSGDFDNSHNQLDLSLEALNRLYTNDRFQSIATFKEDKLKLLTEIQEAVDREVFRKMYGSAIG